MKNIHDLEVFQYKMTETEIGRYPLETSQDPVATVSRDACIKLHTYIKITYMYIFMYIYVCMYMYIHICMNLLGYMYIYVCMHVIQMAYYE